ncbi:MAG: hypothetical protein ACTTHG_06730 [Treponemataceae bacterium]
MNKIKIFFANLFSKIKNFFLNDKIFNSVKIFVLNFVRENKIVSILFAVLIFLLLVLTIAFISIKKTSKSSKETEVPEKIEFFYNYEIPSEEVMDSYYFSRNLKENWDLEEAEKWYRNPDDENLLKQLDEKNTKKVFDILEAAP